MSKAPIVTVACVRRVDRAVRWFFVMAMVGVLALGPEAAAEAGEMEAGAFRLYPPGSLRAKVESIDVATPFAQAVPFRQGEVRPEDVGDVAAGETTLEATARVLTHWPDGSVRMALVEGAVPSGLVDGEPLTARFVEAAASEATTDDAPRRNPVRSVTAEDDHLLLRGEDEQALATLSLQAAWSPITREKVIYPNDPALNDAVAQYGWAHPLAALDAEARSRPLDIRVRTFEITARNRVFTDYAVRGEASDADGEADEGLEWQLLLRVYRAAPVVRWQMTWAMHWDPQTHALTRASWQLRPTEGITSAAVVDEDGLTPLHIDDEALLRFAPNGEGVIEGLGDGDPRRTVDRPDDRWHSVHFRSGRLHVGVAACDLSRLGPSHVRISGEVVEVASWSHRADLGMDLRPSTTPDEFGIGGGDLSADGRGVAFSLDGALVLAEREDVVHRLTLAEAARDHLWFASARDLYESGALGDRVHPDTLGAGEDAARRQRGTQRSVYFLLHSRDRWRWYGALNYGDVRTNFKANRDEPDRGLFRDRWGLHGRYGWRNGSSDVHGRMLYYGLLLEDRRVILAALDYARHVADVDVKHASFFAERQDDEGGMHRRNKDHWSGGVEPQYTTSRGLYLASWLTGDRRIRQVLEEVRGFARDVDRQALSAFRAEPWINRFAETRDPDDLATARRLLDACAASWASRSDLPDGLEGLAGIYFENFRRVGNGMLVLIDFHEHTGEAEYLGAILDSVRHHGVGSYDESYLIAYLLRQEVEPARIGDELLDAARSRVPRQRDAPADALPKSAWTYDWLREGTTGNRQSYNIGRAMRYLPLSLEVFGERGP